MIRPQKWRRKHARTASKAATAGASATWSGSEGRASPSRREQRNGGGTDGEGPGGRKRAHRYRYTPFSWRAASAEKDGGSGGRGKDDIEVAFYVLRFCLSTLSPPLPSVFIFVVFALWRCCVCVSVCACSCTCLFVYCYCVVCLLCLWVFAIFVLCFSHARDGWFGLNLRGGWAKRGRSPRVFWLFLWFYLLWFSVVSEMRFRLSRRFGRGIPSTRRLPPGCSCLPSTFLFHSLASFNLEL